MAPIDDALSELRVSDTKNISKIARAYGVQRSTLSKRYYGVYNLRSRRDELNSILSHQQERTLVAYIDTLTRRGIPPTPTIIRNFVFDVVKVLPSRQ